MLVREQGRAWARTGYPDVPSRRSPTDTTYGNVPDTLDHPEVWEDWSGGFGDAYRRPDRPNVTHWSRGFDLRFPRQGIHCQAPQLLPARYASTRANADFFLDVPLPGVANPPAGAGAVLALGRGFVSSYVPTQFQNTAGSAFDRIYEATGGGALGFGHRPALVGSYTYIPNTDGSSFYQRGHDGLVYTLGPNQPTRWFATAAGRMWFNSNNRNMLRSVSVFADPLVTSNYAATIGLGNGWLTSDDAVPIDNQLYVGFPDGAYQGNLSGTFNNILGDVGAATDVDNCRDLTAFQGGLVAAAGPHLYWFRPSSGGNAELHEIGPGGIFSNRSAIRGRFTCVKGNGKWLYAGLFTGSGSWFMVGRDASPGLPYVWHPIHDFLGLNVKISRIHVDSISTSSGGTRIPNRIWCATDATFGAQAGATAPVFFWPIPYGDNNPLSDTAFSPNYMGSARMDLGESDWGAPGTPKVWRTAEVIVDSLLAGIRYTDLFYSIDQGARTPLGRVESSPKSKLHFQSLAENFVQGQSLGMSIESFTASANNTPVYRAGVFRGTLRPSSIQLITARTFIGNNVLDRRGGKMRPGSNMIRELRSMAEGTGPSYLTDLAGATGWVAVQSPIEEQEIYQRGFEEPEIMATVRMAVLDFTISSLLVGGQDWLEI